MNLAGLLAREAHRVHRALQRWRCGGHAPPPVPLVAALSDCEQS